MDELKLPEQLKGSWHHALILTYGLDIPFFENALWGQFGAHCRNKVILADGKRYLEECANCARSGLARHVNQRYVAEGIYVPRAAHAKLILLTHPERGRLLVGSGNLNLQGYASGGELFTRYDYSAEAPEALAAFLSVRELLEGLTARHYVSAPAQERIQYLLEGTPWFFQPPAQGWRPVRHNLERSFLDQLQQAVGGEPIEELSILSPFYDKGLVALEHLLTALAPRQVRLLMQPSYTSVDLDTLKSLLSRLGKRCLVYRFSKGDDSPYVHAKLYLLKLHDRAICLQGSPNLSQVAMLLTVPQSNVELTNLLTGPRHAFDDLIDALDVQQVERLDALDLSYQTPEPSTDQPSDDWHLTGGEWHRDRLHLSFYGPLPGLDGASLVIANRAFDLEVQKLERQGLTLKLSPAAASLLERPVPVVIRWGDEDDGVISNPVFVCNRAALANELQVKEEGETLDRVGDLDLDDEEFEQLLGELEAALPIDRQSVWQLAGRTPPAGSGEEDEAFRLDYADIDYDLLRQHPKIQQYLARGTGGQRHVRSRLQIILSSITDHFQGLLEVPIGTQLETTITELEESETETEEDREQEDAEKQHRRWSYAKRIRQILKNFIRRYLRGIQSPDFQDFAGFEVIAHNYEIFAHILWRLFAKDWVEPEFVVESLLQTWEFFWGSDEQAGYYAGLDQEQQAQVRRWVREYHADAELLAALYYSACLTDSIEWEDLCFALRDLWRGMLRHPPFDITAEILEETWRIVGHLLPYQPPIPTAIVDELSELADFETETSFRQRLEGQYGYPLGSCRFERVKVRRASFADPVLVNCLVITTEDALPTLDVAIELLQEWIRFEDSDYYRIASPDHNGSRRMLFYEVSELEGVYWARDRGEPPVEFDGPISPKSTDWDAMLSRLQRLAAQVDTQLTFPAPVEGTIVQSEPFRPEMDGKATA